MHSVQLSLTISASRASFFLLRRWVHKLKRCLGGECLLEHQGLVLCSSFCVAFGLWFGIAAGLILQLPLP